MAQSWSARLSRLRKLFAVEHLPPPPMAETQRRTRSARRHPFALERLAHDPELPSAPGRSWLRLLLAPEPLARDPELPRPPRRAGWLRLLLAPERIDPE